MLLGQIISISCFPFTVMTVYLSFIAFIFMFPVEIINESLKYNPIMYNDEIGSFKKLISALKFSKYFCISVGNFSNNLLISIIKEMVNLNKSISITTTANSVFQNNCDSYMFLNVDSANICDEFYKFKPVYLSEFIWIIFVDINMNRDIVLLQSCVTQFDSAGVLVKNLQSHSVYKLSSPLSIPRYFLLKEFTNTFIDHYPLDFKGRIVNLATFHCPPFTVIKNNDSEDEEPYGLEMSFFKEIASVMNFTWRLVPLKSPGKWGVMADNGTMIGGVPQALREGDADVGFCNIWHNDYNINSMDYGPPLNQIYVSFMVRRPYILNDRWHSLISIFQGPVWFATFVSFILTTSAFWLSWNYSTINSKPSIIECALKMVGVLTLSTQVSSPSNQTRLVTTCWSLFAVLFTTSLTSSVVTRLTVPIYSPRIDTVKQLVQNNYYWTDPSYFLRNYSLKEFVFDLSNPWQNMFEAHYKYIPENEIEHHITTDDDITFPAQRWGDEFVIINVEGVGIFVDLSGYRLMRRPIRSAYTSFGLRRHSPLNEPLNRIILQFCDYGIWNFWRHKLTGREYNREKILVEYDHSVFKEPEKLTLLKLYPVFFLLIIGISFACCIYLIEIVSFKYNNCYYP